MDTNIDWSGLGFNYRETKYIVVSTCKEGRWSEPKLESDFNLPLSCFSGALHYASSCFEGLKAFRGVDGKIRLFRPEENAQRMIGSGAALALDAPSEQLFIDMCICCIKANAEYIPPYGTGASLYLRPLLVGSNAQLGVKASVESVFVVMCSPVGSYSGAQLLSAGKGVISRNYDRVAPNGTGAFKLSCNYAPTLHPYNIAHNHGYRELLFLDSATKTCIDEFASANFFAIMGDTYITPLSDSILPSITNKSLRQIASDMGLKVEVRPVKVEELEGFDEVNSCGTGVSVSPVSAIDDKLRLEDTQIVKTYTFTDGCGKVSRRLYDCIRGIQDGVFEDKYGWCMLVE